MDRETKLYPSTTDYQYTDTDEMPLSQVISYLQTISKDKKNVRIRGLRGMSVWYTKTLTDLEVMQEKYEALKQQLTIATRDGLTAEQLKELVKFM